VTSCNWVKALKYNCFEKWGLQHEFKFIIYHKK
jgi:hypothetical protein